LVTDITDNVVTTRQGDQVEQISARTIWAAGVKAANGSGFAHAQLDRVGGSSSNLTLVYRASNIFVVGDLSFSHQNGNRYPV